jgi:hypothetical protein
MVVEGKHRRRRRQEGQMCKKNKKKTKERKQKPPSLQKSPTIRAATMTTAITVKWV